MPARRRRVSTTRRRTTTRSRTTRAKYDKGKYEITVFKKGASGKYKKADRFYSDRYPGDNDFPPGTKISVKYKEPKYDPSTSIAGAKYHVIIYKKGSDGRRHKVDDFWDSKKPPASILKPDESMEIHEYTPNK